MDDTTTKTTAVSCDDCGMDMTYTVVTDGDTRTCTLACKWCGNVADERVQTRSVSTALVNLGRGGCQRMDVETWA